MKQTRLMSFIEASTNVFVGFWLAIATQYVVFPIFGMEIRFWEHLAIGSVFVAVSIVRSYALRRVFEWLHIR
jgi:hypothetical protein